MLEKITFMLALRQEGNYSHYQVKLLASLGKKVVWKKKFSIFSRIRNEKYITEQKPRVS